MIKEIEILNYLIADMPHGIVVDSIVDNGDTWTLNTETTYYLTISTKIEIDGLIYKVTAFELNESITIKGVNHTTAPTATFFDIPSPVFRHGSPKMVNNEHSKTNFREAQKYPLIWLVEIVNIDHKGAFDSLISSELDANLMFFTSNDKANWLIDDHYVNAIYPMLNEIEYFMVVINSKKAIFSEDIDYTTTNHVNFGDYLLNRGNQENIISDAISGVQLSLRLPYLKSYCNSEDIAPICPPCSPVSTSINSIFYSSVVSGGSQNIIMKYENGDTVTYTVNQDNEVIIPNCTPGEDTDDYGNGNIIFTGLESGDELLYNGVVVKTF